MAQQVCGEARQRDADRLHLVFRGGEEYLFAVGESSQTLTVRLSSAAIGLFLSHGMGADGLARIAARWAQGRGRTRVDLALTGKDFTELYLTVFPSLPVPLDNGSMPCGAIRSPHVEATDPIQLSDPRIPAGAGALPAVFLT